MTTNKMKILDSLVREYESKFDKDVINFLLSNIEDSELEEKKELVTLLNSNFNMKTDFYGQALFRLNRIEDNKLKEDWLKILKSKKKDLENVTFELKHKKYQIDLVQKCNVDTLRALDSLVYFAKHQDEFKNVNMNILALDIISEKQSGSLNLASIKEEDARFLLDIVFNKREDLTQMLGSNEEFISKTVKSDLLKNLLYINSKALVSEYLNKEEIGIFAIECLGKNFTHMAPYSLVSVLNKFTSIEWVDSIEKNISKLTKKKTENFPMLLLFKEIFFNAYGINIVSDKNEEVGKRFNENASSWSFKKIENLHIIMDYLLPEIKNKNISNEQVANLYYTSLRMNDVLLVELLDKTFPIRELLENLEDKKLKSEIELKFQEDAFIVHVIQKDIDHNGVNRRKYKSWKEWKIEDDMKILEKELTNKDISSKKMKI